MKTNIRITSIALLTGILTSSVFFAPKQAHALFRENDSISTINPGSVIRLRRAFTMPANTTAALLGTTRAMGERSQKTCNLEYPTSTEIRVLPRYTKLVVTEVIVESNADGMSAVFSFENDDTLKLRCFEVVNTGDGLIQTLTDKFTIWKLRGVLIPAATLNLAQIP